MCYLGESLSLHHQAGDVGRGGGWAPSRGDSQEQTRVRALHGGEVPAQMGVYPAGKRKGTGPTGETLLGYKGQHWRQPPPPPSLRHQPSRMRAVGLEASPRATVPAFWADSREMHVLSPHPVRAPKGVWCAGIGGVRAGAAGSSDMCSCVGSRPPSPCCWEWIHDS